MILHHGSSLIRKSADQRLFAATRSLSQLVTSFIGSWCQGIRSVLLFAWTSVDIRFWISCSLSAWIAVYHVLYSYFFRLAKLFNFTQLWKDLIFHHIFSLCLLSLFVYLILFLFSFQWSTAGLSLLKLDFHRTFKLLKVSFESLKRPVKIKVGGLKWTRTTDLALIRRAL